MFALLVEQELLSLPDHTQLLRKAKQFLLHWWKIVTVTFDDDHTQVLRKAKQSLLHWWKIVTATFDDDHTQVLRKAKQFLLHWWKIVTVTFFIFLCFWDVDSLA
jgi:hypothetical protein